MKLRLYVASNIRHQKIRRGIEPGDIRDVYQIIRITGGQRTSMNRTVYDRNIQPFMVDKKGSNAELMT